MGWVELVLTTSLLWTITSTIEKYTLTKWIRNPLIPTIILAFISLIAALIILGIRPELLLPKHMLVALGAGVLSTLSIFLYFRAVKIEEISRVVPLFFLTPLFVCLLAGIFLGEMFSADKYIGVALLIIGAVLLSLKKGFRINTAFWYMIACDISLAISAVLIKYLLNFADFWTVFSYVKIGGFIAVIPIVPGILKEMKTLSRKPLVVLSVGETISVIAYLIFVIASAMGPISLVNALTATQAVFILVVSGLLSLFYPNIIKEETNAKTVLVKSISVAMIIIGVYLVS